MNEQRPIGTPYPPTFAALLRHYRGLAELTQEELAERASLSPRTISDLERGVKLRPQAATLRLLTGALGLDARDRAVFAGAAAERRPPPGGLQHISPRAVSEGYGSPTAQKHSGSSVRLARPLSTFIGRQQELAEIKGLLARSRLLTLVGPGGVGKTRLALEVLCTIGDQFETAYAVDLAPIRAPSLVLPALANALGLQDTGNLPLLERMQHAIGSHRVFLVLDNFEHVLDAVPLVADLLQGCSHLRILATSRAPLRLTGEQEYPVPPLDGAAPCRDPMQLVHGDAVSLFVDRSRAMRPDFTLTHENAATITAICSHLDRLPLAIELAAAHSRLLPPRALLARLEQRLPLLTGGPLAAPARQRTIEATIAWSYNLLSETERTVFRQLAIFVGGFTLQSAAAVLPDKVLVQTDLFHVIESLAAQSLLREDQQPNGDPRLFMLETIRAFGMQQLVIHGEADRCAERHAQRFLTMAEQGYRGLHGTAPETWLDQLDVEYGNLRAAVTWFADQGDGEQALRLAGALWEFVFLRGHAREHYATLLRLFDLPGPTTTTHSRALSAAGCLAGLLGDYGMGARLLADALTAATASGDAQALAQAHLGLGAVAAARNEAKVARPHFAAAMEQFAAAGDLFQVAHVECMLGLLALHCEHDHMAAAAHGDRSLATFRSLGNGLGVAIALELVGELHRMAGNSQNARQFGAECLELYRRVQDQPGVAAALHNLGNAAFDQEEWAQAHEHYTDALQLHWRLGNQRMVGVLLDRCACLAALQHRPEATMRLGGAAAILYAAASAGPSATDQAVFDHWRRGASQTLGAAAAAAWNAGRLLSPEQAIAEALNER